jgi:hypothetical protein
MAPTEQVWNDWHGENGWRRPLARLPRAKGSADETVPPLKQFQTLGIRAEPAHLSRNAFLFASESLKHRRAGLAHGSLIDGRYTRYADRCVRSLADGEVKDV